MCWQKRSRLSFIDMVRQPNNSIGGRSATHNQSNSPINANSDQRGSTRTNNAGHGNKTSRENNVAAENGSSSNSVASNASNLNPAQRTMRASRKDKSEK